MKQDTYIKTPELVSFSSITQKKCTLSAKQYMELDLQNNNFKYVKDFLERDLKRKDLGTEVGSRNYIEYSIYSFLRTKALKSYSCLPDFNKESLLYIMPSSFVNMNLKKDDIIISKDGNIGEAIILDKDYPNMMLCGALYRLPIINHKYYLLSFLKHNFFKEQLDFMVPKGATLRHAKTLFLDCKIPFPNRNKENIVKFVEVLTQAIIHKERLIKKYHAKILNIIEIELTTNQKKNQFIFSLPTLNEVKGLNRLDTNLYRKNFKKNVFKIKNYKNGFQTIKEAGFTLSRGQNLQVSNIGESVYSNIYYPNFYTLMLPKYISKYGVVNTIKYLGNKNKLKVLKRGDLIFGAEGFEKGRSIVVVEDKNNIITNIHGITIHKKNINIQESVFIKCFLDYIRYLGMVDLYAVGGNGGSLAQAYWNIIPFPKFPENKQKEISLLYHNVDSIYQTKKFTLDNFLKEDDLFNKEAGIYELDKTLKYLKGILNKSIADIIQGKDVNVVF